MPIEIEYEPNDICVLRIRGVLKQSEFAAETSDTGGQNRRRSEAARARHCREL